MGRRAKKAPVQTKKRATLAKRFKCPFCANQNSVECKMDNRNGLGSLNCRICDASFQMPIHHLHEPIDVFSEWLDSCEAAERGEETADGGGGGGGGALDEGHGNTNTIHSTSGFVQDSDEDDDGLGFGSGLDRTSKSSSSSAKGQKGSSAGDDGGNQQSYSALGLDDSDDDDSD